VTCGYLSDSHVDRSPSAQRSALMMDTTTGITHSVTTLPVELIIAIIEELALDNAKHALCAFSLVCSSLLPFCRKHLFHSFDLRTGSQSTCGWNIVNKFATFLSQNHHLIPYARAVHILAVGTTWPFHRNWIYTTPGLTYIIRLLTSLHTFELIVADKLPWDPLPTSLKDALFFMVSQYSLKKLRITGISDIPLPLFTQARHLKSFHAHQVSCHVTGSEVCQYHDPILLEELSFGHSTHLLHIFLENTYFDFSGLRKITIDISSEPDDLKLSWSVIARAGVSLQHLEFRHSNIHHPLKFLYFKHNGEHEYYFLIWNICSICLAATPNLLPYITLRPHATLKSFSFTVLFMTDQGEHLQYNDPDGEPDGKRYSELTSQQISMLAVQGFLPWCHLLQTAPSSLRLITITMDCYALGNEELRDRFKTSDSSKWSDLDKTLANSERLPRLQKVIFCVNLPYSSSESDSDFDEEDSLIDDDDSDSNNEESDERPPPLSLEEAAYYIRRNLKLTRRVAIVEVLAGDS